MTQLLELQARIGALGDLDRIVGALRVIAAGQSQTVDATLPALRAYARTMAASMRDGRDLIEGRRRFDDPQGAQHLIIVGAEHGFCGGFNDQVLAHAKTDASLLGVVGQRAAQQARDGGLTVAWSMSLPSHPSGLSAVARSVTDQIFRRLDQDGSQRVVIVHHRAVAGSGSNIVHRSLTDDPPSHDLPTRSMPPLTQVPADRLVLALMAEYFQALVLLALTESFHAEAMARFLAMDAAKHAIGDRTSSLAAELRTRRQDEITNELIELIAGASDGAIMPA